MRELTEDERKRRIEIILDGKRSEYWGLLKETMERWRDRDNRFLDAYKKVGVTTEEGRRKYNEVCLELNLIERFLNINDEMQYQEKSFMQRMKHQVQEVFKRGESFVNAFGSDRTRKQT